MIDFGIFDWKFWLHVVVGFITYLCLFSNQRYWFHVVVGIGVYVKFFLDIVPITHRWRFIFLHYRIENYLATKSFDSLLVRLENADIQSEVGSMYDDMQCVFNRILSEGFPEVIKQEGRCMGDEHQMNLINLVRSMFFRAILIRSYGGIKMAFSVAGGGLVFTSEFFKGFNLDQMAMVVAHEMAHIFCRHMYNRLFWNYAWYVIIAFEAIIHCWIDFSVPLKALLMVLYSSQCILYEYMVIKRLSRRDETEADIVALHLVVEAGFDPFKGIDFLEKILESEPSRNLRTAWDEFYSTHPNELTRIVNLYNNLVEVFSLYK